MRAVIHTTGSGRRSEQNRVKQFLIAWKSAQADGAASAREIYYSLTSGSELAHIPTACSPAA